MSCQSKETCRPTNNLVKNLRFRTVENICMYVGTIQENTIKRKRFEIFDNSINSKVIDGLWIIYIDPSFEITQNKGA